MFHAAKDEPEGSLWADVTKIETLGFNEKTFRSVLVEEPYPMTWWWYYHGLGLF